MTPGVPAGEDAVDDHEGAGDDVAQEGHDHDGLPSGVWTGGG